MSIANLIFKKKKNEISTIEIDVTTTESHSYSSTVTSFPVENGSNISDHIINNPVELNMKGFITNFPVGYLTGRIGPILRGDDFDRAKSAYEEFMFIRESKVPFFVSTTLGDYQNMVITDIVFDRDKSTKNALKFSASMKQLEIVFSETVQFDTIRDEFKDQGSSTVTTGKQSTKVATSAQVQKATFLARIFDFLGRSLKQ